MTDPAILFVKPNAVSARDKKSLQAAGVLIVEIEDPNDVKFVRPQAEIPSGEMLRMACDVIARQSNPTVRENFAKMICSAIMANGRQQP